MSLEPGCMSEKAVSVRSSMLRSTHSACLCHSTGNAGDGFLMSFCQLNQVYLKDWDYLLPIYSHILSVWHMPVIEQALDQYLFMSERPGE
jgi:hypothetical protein